MGVLLTSPPFPSNFLPIQRHTVLYPVVKNDFLFDQHQQQQQQTSHQWTMQQENEHSNGLPCLKQCEGPSLCLRRKSIVVGFSPGDRPTTTIIPKKKDKTLIRRCSSQSTTTKPDKTSKFLLQSNHSRKFHPYVKPVKIVEEEAMFGNMPDLSSNHYTFDTGADILDDDMVFKEFDWITTQTSTNHLPLSPPLSPSDSHETFMLEPLDDYVLFP